MSLLPTRAGGGRDRPCIDGIDELETVSNSEQTCNASSAIIGWNVPGEEDLFPAFWLRAELFLRSKAIMKVELKPVIRVETVRKPFNSDFRFSTRVSHWRRWQLSEKVLSVGHRTLAWKIT